ncbi:MAG: DUF1592 domain-containing protein [Bryobacterales bacterium]|nr:DUF1592 domain-containing protein [Bryobacterales bacterium]
MRPAFLALLAATLPAWGATPAPVRAFLDQYCVQCHGAKAQMGQRRFDQLTLPVNDADTQRLLQDAVDQLNLSHMPPKGARQPQPGERTEVIQALTAAIADAQSRQISTGGRSVLRRLNRREYRNTVGDLLALNMSMFDPTASFPRDQTAGQMDNLGDVLVTSGYLLHQYLQAADTAVEKALQYAEKPREQFWIFKGDFRQQPEVDYAHREIYGFRYLCLYENQNSVHHEGAYGLLWDFQQGVPADGFYEIKVLAEAKHRRHPYSRKVISIDPDVPFRMGVVPGNLKAGPLHHPQPIEPSLGEVFVADDTPEWHTFRVWLDAGHTPRFTFPNGQIDGRGSFQRIIRNHRDLLPADFPPNPVGIRPARPFILRHAQMPHIRIHEVKIRGPLYDQWPLPSVKAVLGGQPFQPSRTRELLERFAGRAYRRPARPDEVGRLMAVVGKRKQQGRSDWDAFKDGLKAAMASPAFLYLSETDSTKGRLPADALASRLSYFLWSSMPDAELRRAASDGSLLRPDVLQAQVARLLVSPRSQAFVEGFLDSWLNLRALGDMPPDRDQFERYYAADLQAAMKKETQLFLRYLLDQNRSVLEFVNSDTTFVNKPLAQLYGLKETFAPEQAHLFRQVRLSDPVRGGLLGQGSVLTVSANGIETSPVTRGIWVLENILGTPPAPPPDNVPPIDPDVRGAKSIRDLLSKHRENATCFACHQKIDPLGFALENFDPIGAWRTKYPNGATVDAAGQLTDGKAFRDLGELKKILADRKTEFTRMLASRLLTYACGRRMEPADRPRLDRIVERAAAKGYGFRDLLEQAVLSDIFLSK